MRDGTSPAFLFYVNDWRGSRRVANMTFAERGMYFEMLVEQWDAGSVPGTPTACAALLGGTAAEWQRAWPKLRPCFSTRSRRGGAALSRGRVANQKLEAVRQERLRYQKAQAESGLRGAQARWRQHGKPIGSPSKPNGVSMAKNGSSSSSSSSRSKGDVPTHPGAVAPGSEGHLVSANGSGLRERFDAFWDAYPKQEERVAAWDAWQKLRPDSELTAQMCAALVWQRRKDDWLRDSGRFIPLPAKWLTGRRWLDKPTATPRLSDKTIAISRTIQEFSKS